MYFIGVYKWYRFIKLSWNPVNGNPITRIYGPLEQVIKPFCGRSGDISKRRNTSILSNIVYSIISRVSTTFLFRSINIYINIYKYIYIYSFSSNILAAQRRNSMMISLYFHISICSLLKFSQPSAFYVHPVAVLDKNSL